MFLLFEFISYTKGAFFSNISAMISRQCAPSLRFVSLSCSFG